MVQFRMLKTKAIEVLGGSTSAAADALGVTYQAVMKWPDELPARIVDRVIAALVRQGREVPSELLALPEQKAA